MAEEYVKKYFKQPGTVSRWWDTDEMPDRLKSIFMKKQFLLRNVLKPKNQTILDVGAGKGRFAMDFALAGAKQVFALDISREMLQIARERARKAMVLDKITFLLGDAENLNLRDDFFDVSICMATFVHLPNPRKAVSELIRVTKPNGKVVADVTFTLKFSVWLKLFLNEYILKPTYSRKSTRGVRSVLRKMFGFPLRDEAIVRHMSPKDFRRLFINGGLKIVKTIKWSPWNLMVNYIVSARKPLNLN